MPEKPPAPESYEEFSEQEKWLIANLKWHGLEDEKTRKLLNEWLDGEESRVRSEENLPRAQAEFILKQAKLWRAAGYNDVFLQNLVDAHYLAKQGGEQDLSDKIETIFGELQKNEPELYEKMISTYKDEPENLNL